MRREGTALVPGADCTGMASMVSSVQMTIWDAAIGGKKEFITSRLMLCSPNDLQVERLGDGNSAPNKHRSYSTDEIRA